MLHPSYTELMKLINQDSEDDTPVINSRYSIVMATAKRARQIIGGDTPMIRLDNEKPLSTAVKELEQGKIRILAEDQNFIDGQDISAMADRYVEENIPSEEEARAIIEERAEAAGEVQ